MSALDPRLQRLGGRVLRRIPEGWLTGLRSHGQDLHLLPLAEGAASFAVDAQAEDDPRFRESLVLLALLLLVSQAEGNTCLPVAGEAFDHLAADFGADADALRALLNDERARPILGVPGERKPILQDGAALYAERLFRAETGLAGRIRARMDAPVGAPVEIEPAILETPTRLSAEQRAAVAAALAQPLTLISGGPGTGKTSIVVAMLRAALRSGIAPAEIALAAPTGKAANRMFGAIKAALDRLGALQDADRQLAQPSMLPRTLHGLLGYMPAREWYRHHEANPLGARLVVVDEASMIDLVLMERLLRALPGDARLVLLGDADQLPSVDPGSVFRDLVARLPQATVRLTHSYRMDAAESGGAAILTVAKKVNGEIPGDLFEAPHPITVRTSLDALEGVGVELLETDEKGMQAFLDRWLAREIEGLPRFSERIHHVHRTGPDGWRAEDQVRLKELFEHLDRARILCPLKDAPKLRGSYGINAWLHAKVRETRDQGLETRLSFSLGEPVLMTHNDYRRGIFNGDQGLMLLVAREQEGSRLEVVFPTAEGYRAFAAGPLLGELELAYALTVHKSQGSEFDRVALVLPEQESPLATREVLYTALTRAKNGVTVLGTRDSVFWAAAFAIRRDSGLGRRLLT